MLSSDARTSMVRGPVTPPPLADTLRLSYLFTLPFFTTVAYLSNFFIVCIFSTEKMKKYRASVFFRFLAMVDVINSLLVFGVMWLAVVLPTPRCMLSSTALHCQLYTVIRYTVQDLSAWGLVFLVLERCLSETQRKQKRKSGPLCVVVTVGRFHWVIRHLASKVFLFVLSLQALLLNLVMVCETGHELDVKNMMDCFSTWKVPEDFSYGSLSMKHSMLSVVFPSLACVLADVCMHLLLSTQRKERTIRPVVRPLTTIATTTTTNTVSTFPSVSVRLASPPPSYTTTTTTTADHNSTSGQTRSPARRFFPAFWFALLCPTRTSRSASPSLSNQKLVEDDALYDFTAARASDVIVNGCESVASDDGSGTGARRRSFSQWLYEMIKSRDLPLSVVYVEDCHLAAEPSDSLNSDFNAMASIAAVFFVLMMQPQMLYLSVAGLFTISPAHWPLLKNVGIAVDLIVNNRISFPLFLYMFVSGRRVSGSLLRILGDFLAFWCPCLARLTTIAVSASPSQQPGVVVLRSWQGQGQCHPESQGPLEGKGRVEDTGSTPQSAWARGPPFCPWWPDDPAGKRDQGPQVELDEGQGDGAAYWPNIPVVAASNPPPSDCQQFDSTRPDVLGFRL